MSCFFDPGDAALQDDLSHAHDQRDRQGDDADDD
jgi:hypothetical protein